jgi:hypothetical protein
MTGARPAASTLQSRPERTPPSSPGSISSACARSRWRPLRNRTIAKRQALPGALLKCNRRMLQCCAERFSIRDLSGSFRCNSYRRHSEGYRENSICHFALHTLLILILRSRASGVSKDESPDAATTRLHGSRRRSAPPHHEDGFSTTPTSKLTHIPDPHPEGRASGVSKDESPAAAAAGLHGSRRRCAPPHHEDGFSTTSTSKRTHIPGPHPEERRQPRLEG